MTFDTLAIRTFDMVIGFLLGALLFWGGLHRDQVLGTVLAAQTNNTPVTFAVTCDADAHGNVLCRKDQVPTIGD